MDEQDDERQYDARNHHIAEIGKECGHVEKPPPLGQQVRGKSSSFSERSSRHIAAAGSSQLRTRFSSPGGSAPPRVGPDCPGKIRLAGTAACFLKNGHAETQRRGQEEWTRKK